MQDEVRLKRNHILQKASKFVDFTAYLDCRSGIIRHELAVTCNLRREVFLLLQK